MNIYTKVISLLIGLACFGPIGCDRLPESITGRPNPNAATLAPVGPSAKTVASERMVTLESPSTAPSPFVSAAAGQALPGYDASPVVQSGSATGSYASTLSSGEVASGLQVPAAESTFPSSDGKIYINSANLKFVEDRDIAAQTDGLITKMDADEGDVLTSDTLMIQLDDRLANSELDVSKKEFEAASEKAKDDSEIQYSVASNEVARVEYRIQEEITKKGAGTDIELNKKWLEWKRADLAIKVAEVKKKEADLAAGVSQAKQGAAEIQVLLRKINAPFDGIVVEKRKDRHDWVRAGDVILRLVSMEQLRVVGQVQVAQLSAAPHELMGAPANIDITLYPGKIERVSAKVGFVSPVMELSGGYRIWLQIPNIKSNDQWIFREGMPAKIEISTR